MLWGMFRWGVHVWPHSSDSGWCPRHWHPLAVYLDHGRSGRATTCSGKAVQVWGLRLCQLLLPRQPLQNSASASHATAWHLHAHSSVKSG